MKPQDNLQELKEQWKKKRDTNKELKSAKDFNVHFDSELEEVDNFLYIGDLDLPVFTVNPIATTHICERVTLGGKQWSIMLERDEFCPVCGKKELDKNGNELK